ncbi:MAG: FG-GAP repeat protein [Candidatus Polarisedimenticolia bacterium]
MMKIWRSAAAVLCLAALQSPSVRAAIVQPVPCGEDVLDEVKISPADGNIGGLFGWSSDIDGDFAVIGTPGDDDDGVFNSGAAYVYRRDAGNVWVQEAKLLPALPQVGARFGEGVAISGDTVVVGAYGTTVNSLAFSGAVHVFRRSISGVWSLEAFVTPFDTGPFIGPFGDQFGFSVEIDGNRMIVGATHDDDLALDSGAAYIFQRFGTTWLQTAKLHGSDGVGVDSKFFGNDVGVHGNTAVVGPAFDHTLGLAAGAAYVYDFNGTAWIETKILAADGKAHDRFGTSVSVGSVGLVVGAHGDDDAPAGSPSLFRGAAYVFEKVGGVWTQKAKLFDAAGGNQDYFGFQVAISGNTMVASRLEFSSVEGRAYVYRRNANGVWKLLKKVQASDTAPGLGFSGSVSASGKTLLIGAYGFDGAAINSGAAYIYSIEKVCVEETIP